MKINPLFSIVLALLLGCSTVNAQKVTVPLSNDGAWSVNSQPSAVYYNGKSYFAWVNTDKSLVAASYNHTDGTYDEKIVASNYLGDFASPALLVRQNGQILLFSSKNDGEGKYFAWVTTNTEDITAWSAVREGNAYGVGGTLPFAINNDVYVLYRNKNTVGVAFVSGLNASTAQTVDSSLDNKRRGIYGTGNNSNNRNVRLDVPYMRACQDNNGDIHIVFTQLASGGVNGDYFYGDKGSVHYMRLKATSTSTQINFELYKADGTEIVRADINPASPPDIIYSEETDNKKAWAYDIQLDGNGNPVVLYATFNPDGTGHTYNQARWDSSSSQWVSAEITSMGDGLATTAYTSAFNYSASFPAHAFSSGGITFAPNDLSTVYLSKRNGSGIFEIYKYTTTDNGATWAETEAITSGTASGTVNIRPNRVQNAPATAPIDVVWMQGSYTSPVDYATSIVCRGDAVAPTAIAFENETYDFVVDDIEALTVRFAPIFVADKSFTLSSSDNTIVEITADNKIKCISSGTATITATAGSLTATCTVNVADRSVFDIFEERIIADIIKEKMPSSIAQLDTDVASYLTDLQTNGNGSFTDVDYTSTVRTNWPPEIHLNRIITMALAYTTETSSYYENSNLKNNMEAMLQYWQDTNPGSNNWWYNEIAEPQRMGQFLILIDYLGAEKIGETLLNAVITRMGNQGNPSAQTGANRVDVALHYMYRACLTQNAVLLKESMDYIYSPIALTTGAEGIQYDNSYTQHGRQLYTGSYGRVFLDGITKAAGYAVGTGTDYEMPSDKLEILSTFVADSYINIFRGEYMAFNTIGRASTRPEATKKTNDTSIFERMESVDPTNQQVYGNIISRLKGEEAASYEVQPWSIHYYRSDYTLHNQPNYMVDLRLSSTRTVRNEISEGNGEGLKQYFLSDGATGIFVEGDEYYNIFPVWNWAKIPGVTAPEFTTIPKASSYIKYGESSFAGGVTDSLNAVSAYQYKDTYSGINTSANKAWFFFNNEVVCLGNSIASTSGLQVNTTVNQCVQDGGITVSSNGGNTSTFTTGSYNYTDNIDWAYHDKVGYFFPETEDGTVNLTAQQQSGDWNAINTNYADVPTVTKDVFTLSFNHGTDPTDGKYAYVIVPGLASASAAASYNVSNKIEILINSDSLQAVYHKEQKVYGLVFHKAASFKSDSGLEIETDTGCTMLVKDVDQAETIAYVADPQNSATPINIGIIAPSVSEPKLITYSATNPHLGQSIKFVINEDLPLYSGKDVLLDNSGWIITTSIEGPTDTTVGGDQEAYIIDGDNNTAFLFVKPGKTFGGIDNQTTEIQPSFTIDLQTAQDFSSFIYRHRTGNNSASLRASKVSFYGSNSETEPLEFTPIVENVAIATDVAEVKVEFPEVNYRYVKLVITEWDTNTSSTIQVAEFSLGVVEESDLGKDDTTLNTNTIENTNVSILIYPNPIISGADLHISTPKAFNGNAIFEVYDIMGKIQKTSNRPVISTKGLSAGMYFIKAYSKTSGKMASAKFVVK